MREQPKNRIAKEAVKAWRIAASIYISIYFILVLASFVFAYIFKFTYWYSIGALFLGFLLGFIFIYLLPKLRYRRWRYEIFDQEIYIQRGILVMTRRSEEHTSELQSRENLVCRLLLRLSPRPTLFPYTTLFRSLASFVFAYIFKFTYWYSIGALFLGFLLGFIFIYLLPKLRYRRWRYEIFDQEIYIQRGILVMTR